MMFATFDCGHGIALALSRRCVLRVRLPFPVTLASWRYLRRNRK